MILKTLGATRARLLLAYGTEYAILGLATAIFATAAGAVAAYRHYLALLSNPEPALRRRVEAVRAELAKLQ